MSTLKYKVQNVFLHQNAAGNVLPGGAHVQSQHPGGNLAYLREFENSLFYMASSGPVLYIRNTHTKTLSQ